jgi:hypothetical protein
MLQVLQTNQPKGNTMQGNSAMQKIIRTRPQTQGKPQPYSGKQWTRTDKRAAFSQK